MKLRNTLKVGLKVSSLSYSQWWDYPKINHYQKNKLINMLRYAVTHVPYYSSLNIRPESITTVEDLKRFPVMNKSMVQILGDELISNCYTKKDLFFSRTSGSTGEPTTTYFDEYCWLMTKYALKIRRMVANNVGLFKHVVIISELSDKEIQISHSLPLGNMFFKKTMLSIHNSVKEHLPYLKDNSVDSIYGFPSYFDELINYCEAYDIKLPSIPVIFTSSEVLRPILREKIKKYFGAYVCDVYGSTEFKEIAWQCKEGNYHLNFESIWIENHNVGDTQNNYHTLLTSLLNKAMPLIRYQIGDIGRLDNISCACGRQSPVLESISGREIDMIRLPDGRRISPYLLTTEIETNIMISMYQIMQVANDQLEIIFVPQKCKIQKTCNFDSTIQKLLRITGPAMSINFREVDSISRTSSGKYQIFVNASEGV
jgi:phenylacetate-CoA ligase